VAALVSGRTFSSGEALAYHLQSPGRGRVVGQASRGAADHVTPIRLTSHLRAFMSEGYVRDAVTGGNWEGAGVVPDVTVAEGDALEAAVEHLVRADR
jgi:C-terminal processing protease CtpA/Prc